MDTLSAALQTVDPSSLAWPAWIVAVAGAVALTLRAVLYLKELNSTGPPRSSGSSGDEREILVLVRHGQELHRKCLSQTQSAWKQVEKFTKAVEGFETTLERTVGFLEEHDQNAQEAIEKIHDLHDELVEADTPPGPAP